MPFLRNVLKDLVDKRLWPVALLLVGALVAAPIVLGRSSGSAAPAPGPAADATAGTAATDGANATPGKAPVSLATEPSDARHEGGKVRDPFTAPKAAKPKAAEKAPPTAGTSASAVTVTSPTGSSATGSASSGASSSGSSTPAASTSGAAKSTPTTTNPKSTTPKKPTADDPSDTYHVSLKLSVNGAKPKTVDDVARLSPLPSLTDPFFVYLGVLQTTGKSPEKRAVFLVSSDATPNLQGSCHPTKADCESVELAVDETASFDYTAPNGAVTQYELELTAIHKTTVKSRALASAAIARHSVAGAELLRDAAKRNVRAAASARSYRYITATGLLQRAKRRQVTARAAAAGTLIPGIALVSGKHQPGIPVWRSPNKK